MINSISIQKAFHFLSTRSDLSPCHFEVLNLWILDSFPMAFVLYDYDETIASIILISRHCTTQSLRLVYTVPFRRSNGFGEYMVNQIMRRIEITHFGYDIVFAKSSKYRNSNYKFMKQFGFIKVNSKRISIG